MSPPYPTTPENSQHTFRQGVYRHEHRKKRNVKIGEKTYVIASDDDYLEHIGQEFEPHMVYLFEALIKRNDVVFDVGASIGCTSILFGDLSSRVLSFEPSPTTFQFLKENIAQSGFKNIEPQNYALGSQQGESEITFAPSNRSGAFVSNKTKGSIGHTSEHIVIKRIDDVFVDFNVSRVDFIKIDVEEFEKEVIDGAKRLISEFEPILVLELNHWCLNAFQRITVPEFFDY